jgi:hypothetical protein
MNSAELRERMAPAAHQYSLTKWIEVLRQFQARLRAPISAIMREAEHELKRLNNMADDLPAPRRRTDAVRAVKEALARTYNLPNRCC